MKRFLMITLGLMVGACPAEDTPLDSGASEDSGSPDAAMMGDAAMANDAATADTGSTGMDAGPTDAGGWSPLRAHGDAATDPDFSCLGIRTAPTGGAVGALARPVVPFGAPPSVTIPGVPVRFFAGERTTPTCEAPDCVMTLADADGIASAELPAGAWVITEVPSIDGPDLARSLMRTLEFQWVVGDEETINTFSRGTLAGFEETLGRTNDPTLGIVAGRILDCQDRALSGARLRWFDSAGDEIDEDAIYFDGMLPPGLDGSARESAPDGRYAGILPPTATRIEAWGSMGGAAPERIACEAVQVDADTLSVLVLRPTRGDAPSACDS